MAAELSGLTWPRLRRWSPPLPLGLGLAVGLCLTLAALPAAAYRRSATELADIPLWWAETTFSYALDRVGSHDLDDGTDLAAVRLSFATWGEVTCDGEPYRMQIVDGGVVADREAGFDLESDNENLVIFLATSEEWRARDYSSIAIAMTTITHDTTNGRIYDADIEFNDGGFQFAVLPERSPALPRPVGSAQDIQNAATHEIGHVLGLDHSASADATMYSQATAGEVLKRTLADDDREGLCAVQPPESFQPTEGDSGGCSLVAAAPGGRRWWAARLLFFRR